jgi:hypothetical protein
VAHAHDIDTQHPAVLRGAVLHVLEEQPPTVAMHHDPADHFLAVQDACLVVYRLLRPKNLGGHQQKDDYTGPAHEACKEEQSYDVSGLTFRLISHPWIPHS